MGFGFYKKLKDNMKKVKGFLSSKLPIIRETFKKAAPIVKNVLDIGNEYISDEKVRKGFKTGGKLFDIMSDGVEAADEAINHNNYSNIKDWTKTNIAPRIKFK